MILIYKSLSRFTFPVEVLAFQIIRFRPTTRLAKPESSNPMLGETCSTTKIESVNYRSLLYSMVTMLSDFLRSQKARASVTGKGTVSTKVSSVNAASSILVLSVDLLKVVFILLKTKENNNLNIPHYRLLKISHLFLATENEF